MGIGSSDRAYQRAAVDALESTQAVNPHFVSVSAQYESFQRLA